MSCAHDIDNALPLFDFDSHERFQPLSLLEEPARGCLNPPISTSTSNSRVAPAPNDPLPSAAMEVQSSPEVKGKRAALPGKSEPMSIPLAEAVLYEPDVFAMSFASGSSSSSRYDPIPSSLIQNTQAARDDVNTIVEVPIECELDGPAIGGKGKSRESPPTLPPLSFSPTQFSYESADWPSLAGPSSYGSVCSSLGAGQSSPGSLPPAGRAPDSAPATPSPASASPASAAPRRRTISNVSLRSLSTPSLPKMRAKFAGTKNAPGTLARKLLFKKSPPSSPRPASADFNNTVIDPTISPDLLDLEYTGQGNCLIPWSREMHARSLLASPVVETSTVWGTVDSQSIRRASSRLVEPVMPRTKGRSYSSPLPLPSLAFDIVPLEPADIFAQPEDVVPSYFDDWLPKEIKLCILGFLLDLYETEFEKRVASGKWTAHKASSSRNKWTGRNKGVRELFRLSRVSRSWRHLVFDGQLWARLDLRAFPKLPAGVLAQLAQTAGGFVRGLDLSGHGALSPAALIDVSQYLAVHPAPSGGLANTNLTYINLQGCYALTHRSLHHILIRSPFLEKLCLRGQSAVTGTTCDVLANYCPNLVLLDLSRCRYLTAEGIRSLAKMALERNETLMLKELRLSGIRGVNDDMMASLGRAAPHLEILDLSYTTVHNSAVEAFVSCTEEDATRFEVVSLNAREAGRDSSSSARYWRRVTKLRHINLSYCVLLTDHACSHLAHAVPKLEFLELGGIGPEIRDDGVLHLLSTTPYIRRLDLEDATEITDAVLTALTPVDTPEPTPTSRRNTPPAPPMPGHALEHIVLSYANVESAALAALARGCPRLRVLEADNTRLTGLALAEAVHALRGRGTADARVVAVDCRAVGEHAVKELAPHTRPRRGWRAHEARRLAYLDGRDEEGLGVGQDECDPARVVVKTFYSWQTVDAVKAAREKKRLSGARRGANASAGSTGSEAVSLSGGRARWWSPSGRRSSAPNTPSLLDNAERTGEGCTIM